MKLNINVTEGVEAELMAMQAGVRDLLLKSSYEKKLSNKENVITTSAITEGMVVTIDRDKDNKVRWFVVTGEDVAIYAMHCIEQQILTDKSTVRDAVKISFINPSKQ